MKGQNYNYLCIIANLQSVKCKINLNMIHNLMYVWCIFAETSRD